MDQHSPVDCHRSSLRGDCSPVGSYVFFCGEPDIWQPPCTPPFVTAKLVSMLGEPAVSKVCGSNAFVVCRFRDRFPIYPGLFLWSEDERIGVFSVVDVQTKRLLADEQPRFALAIIPPNLGHFVAGLFLDALRQLTDIGLREYSYGPSELEFFKNRLPSHHFDRMTLTLAARSDGYVVFGRTALYVSAVIGAIITVLLLGGALRPRMVRNANEIEWGRIWRAATCILLAGIILNAIICGGFSTVINRFQARVVWLIQLSMITGICVTESHRSIALFWQRKTLK